MAESNAAYELAKAKFEDKFFIEKLTDNEKNLDLITDFNGGEFGKGLVDYLTEYAWEDMQNGDICVYLVKDKISKDIAAFFSLKSGLLYTPDGVDSYPSNDKDFLKLIIDALENNDEELLTAYKCSGMYSPERFDQFVDDARRFIFQKKEKEKREAIFVDKTFSAVEIHDLCKNYNFPWDESDELIPIGIQAFWFGAVPIVLEVAERIGCKYAYLFAADRNIISSDADGYKLVEYYRSNFMFDDASKEGVATVKPRYDLNCLEMVSLISDVKDNQYTIWERFSDFLGVSN